MQNQIRRAAPFAPCHACPHPSKSTPGLHGTATPAFFPPPASCSSITTSSSSPLHTVDTVCCTVHVTRLLSGCSKDADEGSPQLCDRAASLCRPPITTHATGEHWAGAINARSHSNRATPACFHHHITTHPAHAAPLRLCCFERCTWQPPASLASPPPPSTLLPCVAAQRTCLGLRCSTLFKHRSTVPYPPLAHHPTTTNLNPDRCKAYSHLHGRRLNKVRLSSPQQLSQPCFTTRRPGMRLFAPAHQRPRLFNMSIADAYAQ